MNLKSTQLKIAFGKFVIIASMFSMVGCSSMATPGLSTAELDTFQVDCRYKEQQIRFLQSQRMTSNQKLGAGLRNIFAPWEALTDSDNYEDREQISSQRKEWMLNQTLLQIKQQC